MALRGVKPQMKEKRLKLLVYGPAGVGKTTAAIQFDNAYLIDTEKGSDFYAETITKSNSHVFQSNNPDEIKEELNQLLTTKHDFRTLIIDPITQVYQACQDKWSRIFEKYAKTTKEKETQDFGMRYWGRVKSDFKAIQRIMMALDMNVIITSHQKDIYGPGMSKIGVGPDTMKGDEYIFDLVFELANVGGKRIAKTIKERAEIGKSKFPEEFEWSYENFKKFYGQDIITRKAEAVKMATPEMVKEVERLLEIVRIEDDELNKWFSKADVDNFSEMREEQIKKCIEHLNKKLSVIKEN